MKLIITEPGTAAMPEIIYEIKCPFLEANEYLKNWFKEKILEAFYPFIAQNATCHYEISLQDKIENAVKTCNDFDEIYRKTLDEQKNAEL